MNKKIQLLFLLLLSLKGFSQTFQDVTATANLNPNAGQILDVLDYNNDGWDDIIYQNLVGGSLKLYKNSNGVFSDVTSATSLPNIVGGQNITALSFDYNVDGFQDILVIKSGSGGYFKLYKNNCGNNFTDVSLTVGMPSSVNIVAAHASNDAIVNITDYDRDGDLDVVFGRVVSLTSGVISVLTNPTFTSIPFNTHFNQSDIITGVNILSPLCITIDFDNDNDDDILYVSFQALNKKGKMELRENNGLGVFSIVSSFNIDSAYTYGFANLCDIDNDGFQDLFIGSTYGEAKNWVYRNNGNGTFTDVSTLIKTFDPANPTYGYVNNTIFDVDNDGDLDLLSQARPQIAIGQVQPVMMVNNGSFNFINNTPTFFPGSDYDGSTNNRFTIFDYNNDGYLDFFKFGNVAGGTGASPAILYKNTNNTSNYIGVRLSACPGLNPTDPRGVRVMISAGGKRQFQYFSNNSRSTPSNNSSEKLLFGLGNQTIVDTVKVWWADGTTSSSFNISANQVLNLTPTGGNCGIGQTLTFSFPVHRVTACNQPAQSLSTGPGYDTILWSTGENTTDITVTQSGWYYVRVGTSATKCFVTDSVYVDFITVKIEQNAICFGDTTICKGKTIKLDASPRYNCNPFGAPKPLPTYTGGMGIPGYTYLGTYNSHYYYSANNADTWSNSAKSALNNGGYLAAINSIGELNFIKTFNTQNYWLGLYFDGSIGSFKWMNCDTIGFLNWAAGQPNGNIGENYTYMYSKSCTLNGKWKAFQDASTDPADPCTSSIYGLMEIDVDAANTKYLWSTGDTTASVTLTPSSSAVYSAAVTKGASTCSDFISVNIQDLNNQFAQDTFVFCSEDSVLISSLPGMTTYTWNTGSHAQQIYVKTNGWYSVAAVSPIGCAGKDSVYISNVNARIKTSDTTVCINSAFLVRGPDLPHTFNDNYSEDFTVSPFFGWNPATGNFTFNGGKCLGPFHNSYTGYTGPDSATFLLTGLGQHDSIEVAFDLYIHDTWEGNCTGTPGKQVGTDHLQLHLDNNLKFDYSFSNSPTCTQSYSKSGLPGSYPWRTDADVINLPARCDATTSATTTMYRIIKRYAHADGQAYLNWRGILKDTTPFNNICSESWSLANVKIRLYSAIPVLWSTGGTTQDIFVNPTTDTSYWIRVPNGNTYCYDTVNVKTGTTLTVNFWNDTLYSCVPSVQLLGNNGFDTYAWNTGETTQANMLNNPMWYRLYVSKFGCYGIDSIFFATTNDSIVQPNPSTACKGEPFTLSVSLGDNCSPFGSPKNTGYVDSAAIPGYTWIGSYLGHHYYLADTNSSWSSAAQNAINAGGYLAIINDSAEQRFLQTIVTTNSWIGLYKDTVQSRFIWMNCDTNRYTNWASTAPTAGVGEIYTYLYKPTCIEPFKWNTHLNSDASTDSCANTIRGLLEIDQATRSISWSSGESTDSIVLIPTTSQTYSVNVSNYPWPFAGGGCTETVFLNVIDPGFNIVRDSVVKFSCQGDTAILVAPFGFTNYHWSNGDTNQFTIISDFVGWVTCTATSGQCRPSDSVYVNIPAPLRISPIVKNISCKGKNDGLAIAHIPSGVPPYTFIWSTGSTDTIVAPLIPGTYFVTVKDDSGCVAKDTIIITDPDTALSTKIVLVQGIQCHSLNNGTLAGVTVGGQRPYDQFTWDNILWTDTLFPAPAGSHIFTVTDVRGCTVRDSFFLTQPDTLLNLTSISHQILCNNDSDGVITFAASGGVSPYHFLWRSFTDTTYFLSTDTALKRLTSGVYTIVLFDTNFCIDSITLNMIGSDPSKCGLFIPQTFTPNGDGINDHFFIKGANDFPDNELTVFNRWGQVVYSVSNYKNDWDGKSNKNSLVSSADGILPNDTYYYVFVTRVNNKTYSGYIYLTK